MARNIAAIKKKYGEKAFVTWGRRGGNPVLLAQGRGDKIVIIRKRKKS